MANLRTVEEGELYCFPFVDGHQEKDVEEIDFFNLLLVAPDHPWRLLVVGQKRIPEIEPGRASTGEHPWALIRVATRDAEQMRDYVTRRAGQTPADALVAAGGYALVGHNDHTELAIAWDFTTEGEALAKHLGLAPEMCVILAVKNPEWGSPKGYPFTWSEPAYPDELRAEFDGRRFIPAEDTRLLDYEQAQVVLVRDKKRATKAELGIAVSEEDETDVEREVTGRIRQRLNGRVPALPF